MSGARIHPARRDERLKLLASAERQLERSRRRIAGSLARLVACDWPMTSDSSAGQTCASAAVFFLDLLEHPCDLDVLRFFHRHPRAMLTLDDLVSLVGYGPEEIRASVDVLLRARLLAGVKPGLGDPASRPRLYEFTPSTRGGLLTSFLWLASSVDGRRVLRQALGTSNRPEPLE